MKGQIKGGYKLLAVLFAAAALSFAQANGVSAYPAPAQAPQNPSTMAPAPNPVGPGTINYVEGTASLGAEQLSERSIGVTALKPGDLLTTNNGWRNTMPKPALLIPFTFSFPTASTGLSSSPALTPLDHRLSRFLFQRACFRKLRAPGPHARFSHRSAPSCSPDFAPLPLP